MCITFFLSFGNSDYQLQRSRQAVSALNATPNVLIVSLKFSSLVHNLYFYSVTYN